MSKVLVERELLRDSSAELSDWRMSFPDADSGMTDRLVGEIDAILAQPAEVEGVDFGFDDRSVKVSQEAYSIFLEREQHHLAALSAVTAERDRLLEAESEASAVVDRLAKLLAGVAVAVRGPELPLHRHSYHDLPERVSEVIAERDQLRAEAEALRNLCSQANACLDRWAAGHAFDADNLGPWTREDIRAAMDAKEE